MPSCTLVACRAVVWSLLLSLHAMARSYFEVVHFDHLWLFILMTEFSKNLQYRNISTFSLFLHVKFEFCISGKTNENVRKSQKSWSWNFAITDCSINICEILGRKNNKQYLEEGYCSMFMQNKNSIPWALTDIPLQRIEATAIESYGWIKNSFARNSLC